MAGEAALQKLSISAQNFHLRISKTTFACQSLDLGEAQHNRRSVRKSLRWFIKAKPHNLRFVSVKGARGQQILVLSGRASQV